MSSLRITPVPFRSSNLAIPPSPFSPRSPLTPRTPLTPLPKPKKPRYIGQRDAIPVEPPIFAPLQWMWQCHKCRQTYPLGATRRCLEDGHHFCSGISVIKSSKRSNHKIVKEHRACVSEFDYDAWKVLGEWNQGGLTSTAPSFRTTKDCWHNCNYPSECLRDTKIEKPHQVSPTLSGSQLMQKEKKSTAIVRKEQNPATTFDALLHVIHHHTPTLQTLLSPTHKRKTSTGEKSPLVLHTVFEEADEDGDVLMADATVMSPPLPAVQQVAEVVAQLSADLRIPPPRASV